MTDSGIARNALLLAMGVAVTLFPLSDPRAGDGGQAAIGNFTFTQTNWVDPQGGPTRFNTAWGTCAWDSTADPSRIYYVNIAIRSEAGAPFWAVKNHPLIPEFVRGRKTLREAVDCDLSGLGHPPGTDITSLLYGARLDPAPSPTIPVIQTTAPVGDLNRRASGASVPPEVALPANLGAPAGVQNECCDAPTGIIHHRGVEHVQEGTNQCIAGAFSRSIGWLGREYNFDNRTAQEVFGDLIDLGVSGPSKFLDDNLPIKNEYLQVLSDYRGTTRVLDVVGGILPVPGIPEESGTHVIEFIKRELPTNDVELSYDTHIVTVTGYYIEDGKHYVRFYDDEAQGDDGLGDSYEKTAILVPNGDGSYSFRRSGDYFAINALVAEAVPKRLHVFRHSPTAQAYFWTAEATGETLYDTEIGFLSQLRASGGNFTSGSFCALNDNDSPGFLINFDPSPGDGYWFLVKSCTTGGCGSYDSGGPGQLRDRDELIAASATACRVCAHDTCVEGPALSASCSTCVNQVCTANPACCSTKWGQDCIQAVYAECGSVRCAVQRSNCVHTLCTVGEPLVAGCDADTSNCVQAVCAQMPECCAQAWAAPCIGKARQVCGIGCN